MKHTIILLLLTGLFACADNTNTPQNSGNATTPTPQDNTVNRDNTYPDNTGTAPADRPAPNTGQSMSAIMQANMQRMMAMKPTNDADHDFAMMMREHHQGALDMAQLLVSQGQDAELKQMAQKMIADQQREIAIFDRFLQANKPTGNNAEAAKAMMATMHGGPAGHGHGHGGGAANIDHDFADQMIPHHQGAINMAKAYLPHAKNAELKRTAEEIIRSQTVEIGQLQTAMKRFH